MTVTERTSSLPPPLGKYPRFRRAGEFIYVSGVSARLPDGSIDGVVNQGGVVLRDVGVQARRVIRNVAEVLQSAGATLADCIDITVFLTRPEDFEAFNRIYGDCFVADGPARTTVIVRGLPHPDMVVEIKAVAWLRLSPAADSPEREVAHVG
ncbi:RidA family protein [Variovorax sp. GB1P17]|uniref:RidA family protein n=1 Tax=Variovorax sp. GB1P17 TaxID=3443740 RepID=UPI003F4721A7